MTIDRYNLKTGELVLNKYGEWIRHEVHARVAAELTSADATITELRAQVEALKTDIGRAYRALHGYATANRRGAVLNATATSYHLPTAGAAARFVNHGALDGSEYFIGKPVAVLHAALRGDPEEIDAARASMGGEAGAE